MLYLKSLNKNLNILQRHPSGAFFCIVLRAFVLMCFCFADSYNASGAVYPPPQHISALSKDCFRDSDCFIPGYHRRVHFSGTL